MNAWCMVLAICIRSWTTESGLLSMSAFPDGHWQPSHQDQAELLNLHSRRLAEHQANDVAKSF